MSLLEVSALMQSCLQEETRRLHRMWDRHPADILDRYLVSGVEDPRINLQRILTRALLADSLFPNAFTGLIQAEMRFGLCLTWIMRQLQVGRRRDDIMDAILLADCPAAVAETYEFLQKNDCWLPDYVTDAPYGPLDTDRSAAPISEAALQTFQVIWRGMLAAYPARTIRVLEPACGSANDYRFMDLCGLARFMEYTGFDLCSKNVANARRRLPGADFRDGNVLDIPEADASFDYVFVHDLFEHLSLEALTLALDEVLRVAGKEVWLSFFNLADIPRHRLHRVDGYHWNRLSVDKIVRVLSSKARRVELVDMAALAETFGFGSYYNPQAKTLIATM